jgi:hypothetical protein
VLLLRQLVDGGVFFALVLAFWIILFVARRQLRIPICCAAFLLLIFQIAACNY